MKTCLLLFFFLTCFLVQGYEKRFNIAHWNSDAQVIDGVSFPRVSLMQYRGLSPAQMDTVKAVRAMLGDEKAIITSMNLEGVRQMLTGQPNPFYHNATLNYYQHKFDLRGLNQIVQDHLENKGSAYKDEASATQAAINLLEKDLSKMSRSDFTSKYLYYRSTAPYDDWPIDMIFSTLYPNVANVYSRFIVSFKTPDSISHSGVDLNYWNYINQGRWVDSGNHWVDRGELLHSLFIPAEFIEGYHVKLSKFDNHLTYRDFPADLANAYIKESDAEASYVLIFDGIGSDGNRREMVLRSGDKVYYGDSRYTVAKDNPPLPRSTGEVAKLMGVIALCPQKLVCRPPRSIFEKYSSFRSSSKLSKTIQRRINSIQINGLRAKIFYDPYTIGPGQNISGSGDWKVLPFRDALIAEAAQSGFTIIGVSDLKVSHLTPRGADIFVTMDFDEVKLDPKQGIIIFPGQLLGNKVVKSVRVVHRQDTATQTGTTADSNWDSAPGYTSIQFHKKGSHPNSDWRYWGGKVRHRVPKASMFAEVADAGDSKLSVQVDWPNNGTRKVQDDTHVPGAITIDAMRVLSLGTDPVFIRMIEIRLGN